MKVFTFGRDAGRHIGQFGSDFDIVRLIDNAGIHVACFYLDPGGLVGYHPASAYQLFAVVSGEGWVRAGDEGRVPVQAGEAALWSPGEQHEAGSGTGMVAIVVEGSLLDAASEEVAPV